jgi:hypothetical protein
MTTYKSMLGTGIRGTLKTLGIVLAAYATLYTADFITDLTAKKIKNQRELDRIVAEEVIKYGKDDLVSSELLDSTQDSWIQNKDGTHSIQVGGLLASRKMVRHLLTHIYEGHSATEGNKELSTSLSNIAKYIFIQEPQAVIYSLQE